MRFGSKELQQPAPSGDTISNLIARWVSSLSRVQLDIQNIPEKMGLEIWWKSLHEARQSPY